ncbi:MAG: exopolysaccharide biosynthesis polyprenyl glycosylphosphotransferase [Nocardioides sp.]
MTAVLPLQPDGGPDDLGPLGVPSGLRDRATSTLASASGVLRRRLVVLAVDLCCVLVLSAVVLPVDRAPTPVLADLAVAVLWVGLLAATRVYDPRPVPFGLERVRQVGRAGVALSTAGLALAAVLAPEVGSRTIVEMSAAAAATALGQRWLVGHLPVAGREVATRRVVVAGHRRDVDRVLAELRSPANRHFEPVAVCLAGAPRSVSSALPVLHGLDNLGESVARHRADAVIVVPCRHLDPRRLRRLGWQLESAGTQLYVAAGLLDVSRTRTTIGYAGALPLLHVREAELAGGRRVLKHVVERAVAAVALTLLLPLLLGVALVVRLGSEGPALYRQTRVGKDGVPFSILKFRTMTTDADARRTELVAVADGGLLFKLEDDPRVTREGRFLRRYSLDELPQLVNVVRGEMSLVGPRPPLPSEVAQYEPDAHRRLAVTPGMTGLWQVSGRSELSWEESLRLDLRYVDNWSLALDLRILCRTAHAVLGHQGAY